MLFGQKTVVPYVTHQTSVFNKGQLFYLCLHFFVGANCVRQRAFEERPYGVCYAALPIGISAALSIFSMKMP